MAVSNVTLGFVSGAKLFQDTVSANSAVSVQGSSTTIYQIEIDNSANAAEDEYVKFWNTAGAVTVGTTVPDMVIEVRQAVKRSIVIPDGLVYQTGLAVATVTAWYLSSPSAGSNTICSGNTATGVIGEGGSPGSGAKPPP